MQWLYAWFHHRHHRRNQKETKNLYFYLCNGKCIINRRATFLFTCVHCGHRVRECEGEHAQLMDAYSLSLSLPIFNLNSVFDYIAVHCLFLFLGHVIAFGDFPDV